MAGPKKKSNLHQPAPEKPAKAANTFFNTSDFSSIELKIGMRNTTTGTEVDLGTKIQLVELQEKGMVLEVPPRSCAKGHNLIVEIHQSRGREKLVRLELAANVGELAAVTEDRVRIQVNLLQLDETKWKELCRAYSARQEEIAKFFAAAKGG